MDVIRLKTVWFQRSVLRSVSSAYWQSVGKGSLTGVQGQLNVSRQQAWAFLRGCLFKKVMKLSTKGMSLLLQLPFSQMCSWHMQLNFTSPKRGVGSGPEIITCFLVSSRPSTRHTNSLFFMSFVPAWITTAEAELCCWDSCRAAGVMFFTQAPG